MNTTTPFDCPRCGVGLAMSERQGIEIDYCPQCRGVWLDRGELDKIIARAEAAQAPALPSQTAPGSPAGGWAQPPGAPPQQPWGGRHHDNDHRRRDDRREGYGYGHQHGRKRRKSWLEELFD